MNIHTKHQQQNTPCKTCDKILERKRKGQVNAEIKIIQYKSIYQELKPFLIAYQKALKEIWKKPINGMDKKILAKHGLFNITEVDYFPHGTHIKGFNHEWNHQLKQLNKLYKRKI